MRLPLRLSLAAPLLLLAALPLALQRERQAERDRLLARARPLATQQGTLAALSNLASEPNPVAGEARLARALVSEVLASKPDTAPNRASDRARLALAQSLAIDALGREAAGWEALLALGAATYLDWSLAQDNRLFAETRAWELPLKRASGLAPGRTEPARFLSLAYLELWQVLPPWKREQALELLSRGLEDPATFDRLIEPWLEVAGSTDEALKLVPAQPLAWQRLRTLFEQRRDWPALARAQQSFLRALSLDIEGRLEDAEQALARGDRERARVEVQLLLPRLPVDGAFAGLLARAIAVLPPGAFDSSSLPTLSSWWLWALELAELGQQPLPTTVLGRLSHAVEPTDAAQAAFAALMSGELAEAERLERRAAQQAGSGLSSSGWAPYRLARARLEAQAGDPQRAAAYFDALSGELASEPAYWLTKALVAEKTSNPSSLAAARAELARLRRNDFPAAGWRWRGTVARRNLLVASRVQALWVELLSVPEGGAAVDLRWNGRTLATLVAAPTTADSPVWLKLPLGVEPGLSRLEIEPLGRAAVEPGAVKLLPATTAEPSTPPAP